MITTILFDLDGTLLPMDQDIFVKAYIKGLTLAAESVGYSPMILSTAIMAGTAAMVKNNGEKTNEEAFWNILEGTYGESVRKDIHMFDEFYATDFQKIKDVCGFEPKSAELIKYIKDKGYRVVLATNPLFPKIATESRIRWAGLEPSDFEYFTTYETSHYCKPNLGYYRELIDRLQVEPTECLMIGNDVNEDMIAAELGIKVFLLTDCLINKNNENIARYPHGSFDDLRNYIETV